MHRLLSAKKSKGSPYSITERRVNRGTMGVNSLPKTVTRHRRDCDLNPSPSAPESSTLTTRLPSHPRLLSAYYAVLRGNRLCNGRVPVRPSVCSVDR